MRLSHPDPLLALVNATAEWHAGVPPVCSASVRLLDRVHFTVHRGDCVVVHHDDPASARVLLAALGGNAALAWHHRWRAQRFAAPGVRIRRCSVSTDAAAALEEGWSASAGRGQFSVSVPPAGPVVHLVRASRTIALADDERRQWRQWAQRAGHRGDALVLVVRPDARRSSVTAPVPALERRHDTELTHHQRDLLHESAAPAYAGAALSNELAEGLQRTARALLLRHGRLENLRRWE